ncbi:MAG: hypothetical protein ACI4JJ_07220, partial [Huintestinicola sp.]
TLSPFANGEIPFCLQKRRRGEKCDSISRGAYKTAPLLSRMYYLSSKTFLWNVFDAVTSVHYSFSTD